MAGLVDTNLVTLYEYVETASGAAIAMELVDGVALRDLLDDGGPLTAEAALTVMKGSLLGLGVLHRQGVVHRDYKPENVMVDGLGATKLVDYGIAAPVGELAGVAGTPLYMAPEQWVGEPSTAASDVYAASATFVEALTGRTVFTATTVDALRVQHLMAPPSLEGIPEPIRSVAEAGLAKDPVDRITDAAALVAQLETVAGKAYGPDWEEHGRRELAARASLLALLFPRNGMSIAENAMVTTQLGAAQSGPRHAKAGRGVRFGGWGLTAAAAMIVIAGAGAGAIARAADGSVVASASVKTQLARTVLVATPSPTPSVTAHPKTKTKPKAKPKAKVTTAPAPVAPVTVTDPLPAPLSPTVIEPPVTGPITGPVVPFVPPATTPPPVVTPPLPSPTPVPTALPTKAPPTEVPPTEVPPTEAVPTGKPTNPPTEVPSPTPPPRNP